MTDWAAIKTEYLTTKISYRALAQKYGVSMSAISKRAAEEKWRGHKNKAAPPPNVATLAGKLIEKADLAIEQLGGQVDAGKLKQLVASVKDLKEITKAMPGGPDAQAGHDALVRAIREAGKHGD